MRDRAGVQHRPLLGQVLAGRQARRVVARVDDLSLRSAPEHGCNTSLDGSLRRYASRAAHATSSACAVRTPRRTCRRWSRTTSRRSASARSCEALLLTAKARVIAPLVVLRRGVDDFLLLTEPGLGERVRSTLLRSRFAAKCEIERRGAHVVGRPRREPTAFRPRTTACPPSRCSTRSSSRRSTTTSSSSCASAPARRASAARSTIACFPPRPGSTSAPSTSRRAATRARSRSRASTTAVA